MGLRIAVVGGASSYTPELFADLVEPGPQLDVEQVTLSDPNAEKLALVADVGRRILTEAGSAIQIRATADPGEALSAADFVILQIRVGGLQARVRDETLPMELGMVGNETTGPGGFVCALRTVPAALQIARELERLSPQAWLLNLSNPAGIVTEALLKHTGLRTVGFCNIPINTTYELAALLDVPAEQVELRSFGLNHLSWTRAVYVDGQERLQALLAASHDRGSALYRSGLVEELIDPQWLQALNMIPSWYLRYYYYPEEVLAQDRQHASKGRTDQEAEAQLRRLYLTEGYAEPARRILASKGGAQYYLPVLQVIRSVVEDRGDVVVVDVRNQGALPDLPPDVCVEVPARIKRAGVEPIVVGSMPLTVRGLVQVVKAYEELTVEAALAGSHAAALAALAAHPLVGSASKARAFWERVLQNESAYLQQFLERVS